MISARCEQFWQAKRVRNALAGPMPHDILPDLTVERPVYVWDDFDGFTVEVGKLRIAGKGAPVVATVPCCKVEA